jgi:chromate reductase, NAD(P)H dehydrogenase (quinone)
MPYVPKILTFSGSLRAESFNKKLAKQAAAAARKAGAEVTLVELRDLPLPVFDQDLEARDGLPANARRLKELFAANDGLIIASPEYNSSITAALKNAIDWVSRQASPGEASLASFAGKTAAIMSASPGGLGGLRGLVHLRAILGNIQVLVIPDQIAIREAHEAFAADGTLKDTRQQAGVEAVATKLVTTIVRLRT